MFGCQALKRGNVELSRLRSSCQKKAKQLGESSRALSDREQAVRKTEAELDQRWVVGCPRCIIHVATTRAGVPDDCLMTVRLASGWRVLVLCGVPWCRVAAIMTHTEGQRTEMHARAQHLEDALRRTASQEDRLAAQEDRLSRQSLDLQQALTALEADQDAVAARSEAIAEREAEVAAAERVMAARQQQLDAALEQAREHARRCAQAEATAAEMSVRLVNTRGMAEADVDGVRMQVVQMRHEASQERSLAQAAVRRATKVVQDRASEQDERVAEVEAALRTLKARAEVIARAEESLREQRQEVAQQATLVRQCQEDNAQRLASLHAAEALYVALRRGACHLYAFCGGGGGG